MSFQLSAQASTPTPTEPPCCEHCPPHRQAEQRASSRNFGLIAMQPGPDGKEWFLCVRCYREGLPLKKPEPEAEAPQPVADARPAKKRRAG
jgi:hypothetical protein